MILIIAKLLLVYVLEHKHNFHVEHFLSLTVNVTLKLSFFMTVWESPYSGFVLDSAARRYFLLCRRKTSLHSIHTQCDLWPFIE